MMGSRNYHREIAEERDRLRALNAELLAALSGMIELFEDSMVDPELPALDKARAAKVRGES